MIQNNNGTFIPLISGSISMDGKMKIKLVPVQQDTTYIAISHVWAGGMGNPHHNTLPECQLRRLTFPIKRLKKSFSGLPKLTDHAHLDSPIHFWMDTFCVPVGEGFTLARKAAIGSMAKIYTRATTVLVLDPELQSINHKEIPTESLLAYVICSACISQCWTLQEASLSQSWYIQFADGTMNLENQIQ